MLSQDVENQVYSVEDQYKLLLILYFSIKKNIIYKKHLQS